MSDTATMIAEEKRIDARLPLADVIAEIAARREEFDRLSHVPRDMIAQLKRAGIYRAATPKRFGGDALAPSAFLDMIERIAMVDGSAAWVASFGSANVYLAALPLATQAHIYADGPDQAFAASASAPAAQACPANRARPCSAHTRSRSSRTGTWSVCKAPAATICAFPTSSSPMTGPSCAAASPVSTNRCIATRRLPTRRKFSPW
jgi:hypothetical protein